MSKEGDRLREILGEVQEVLDFPTKILKPIHGQIVGLVVARWSMVVARWLVSSFPSAFRTILSLTHLPIH